MNALQLDTDFFRNLGIIAEDETMLLKVTKYVRNLVKKMQTNDPTLLSEEEYFRRLDEAEENYAKGNYYEMKPGESLEDFLIRTA